MLTPYGISKLFSTTKFVTKFEPIDNAFASIKLTHDCVYIYATNKKVNKYIFKMFLRRRP